MRRHKLAQKVFGAILVALLLVGCGTPAATLQATPTQVASAGTSAQATRISPTHTPVPPTPTPTMPAGTIRAVLTNATSGKPLSGDHMLMLAWKAEQDQGGGEITGVEGPYIDGRLFQSITVDEKGAFVLSNIPSDNYLLILFVGRLDPFNPPKGYLLRDKKGQKLTADLTRGQGVDLGEILVPVK